MKYNTTHLRICKLGCLVGVGKTSHTTHDAEHVIVGGIDTNLGSLGSLNSGVGENKLKGGVVNTGEVAGAGGLVLLGAKSEGIHVDSSVGVAGVSLVGLHLVEVGSLTLREAVLSVKLKLGGDDGVLSPAVHIQGGLGKHKGSGIRHRGVLDGVLSLGEGSDVGGGVGGKMRSSHTRLVVGISRSVPVSSPSGRDLGIHGTGRLEETIGINEGVLSNEGVGVVLGDRVGSSESMDGVGKGIDSISVVERLSTEHLEKKGITHKGRAVINVLIRLHNPDELLHGVVEVELDLVGRGTNRLVSSELKLSNEILVGVLGHSATLVGVKEHVIDIEGSSNQGLVVGDGSRHGLARGSLSSIGNLSSLGSIAVAVEGGHSPQALINRADVKVDLDLVVLKGNEGKSKSGVGAKPELKRHVKGGLRKGIAGSAHLAGSLGVARSIDISEGRIGNESKLGGVSNHLEVTSLLLRSHGKLVPDVHPVTILAVNALTSNLHLDLGNELLSGEVQPTGIHASGSSASGESSDTHKLVNLGKSDLKIGAVGKITITADRALNTATEVSLSIKSLLDRFNSKVGVASVCNLPESDLGVASKVNVLSAVSDELHESASHFIQWLKKKK